MKHEKTLAEKAGPVARLDVRERLIAHLPCESWPFGPSVWKTDQIEHRRGLASEIIGPPVRPRDCSSMSISEIVYRVARKGGAVDFEVNDQSKWNAAIAEVLNKTEQLDLTARQSEAAPPDKDVAYLLRDVCVKHPYQNSNETEIQTEIAEGFADLLRETEIQTEIAESAFNDSPVLELWGEHDILRIGQIVYHDWRGSSEAVARIFPFGTSKRLAGRKWESRVTKLRLPVLRGFGINSVSDRDAALAEGRWKSMKHLAAEIDAALSSKKKSSPDNVEAIRAWLNRLEDKDFAPS
jgi:hypothetical protein